MKYMSIPEHAAVKDIDITNILGQKYPYRIDIGKGDIDPPLLKMSVTVLEKSDEWNKKMARGIYQYGRTNNTVPKFVAIIYKMHY